MKTRAIKRGEALHRAAEYKLLSTQDKMQKALAAPGLSTKQTRKLAARLAEEQRERETTVVAQKKQKKGGK
jgi:hypothetical protein